MMPNLNKLAQRLLDDQANQEARQKQRQRSQSPTGGSDSGPWWRDRIGFDPYQCTQWRVITGGDVGYLPKTPMRPGPEGFYIHCKACNSEFESKGMAYCVPCLALPVEERHAMKPAYLGRMCQAPGCENAIPRTMRTGSRYCSKACRQRASYSTRNLDS